jgi:hypothetical protein
LARFGDADLKGANLGDVHLKIEQLADVRTLYRATLNEPLLEAVTRKYPHLLEAPQA